MTGDSAATQSGTSLRSAIRISDALLVLAPTIAPIAIGLALGRDAAYTWIGVAFSWAVLAAALIAFRKRPPFVVATLMVWLTIERFAVAAISPLMDSGALKAVLAYKELFFPLLLLIGLPRILVVWREAPRSLRVVDLLAVGFCLVVLVGVVLSPAPATERILYARRLTILPVVYLGVRLMPWQPADARPLLYVVALAAASAAVFGLVERLAGETLIWRQLIPAAFYYHQSALADLSARGTDFPYLGLPVTFWQFSASGLPERRLVSTFLEATTLASFLALGTLLMATTLRRSVVGLALVAVTGAATILTLSKAGWATLAVGFAYLVVIAVIPRLREPRWLLSMAAGVVGGLIVLAVAVEASGATTGALAHFTGLKQGIESVLVTPFGHGVGIGGNFGATDVGAESTFGVMLVQMGAIGLVLWSAWLLGLAVACGMFAGEWDGSRLVMAAMSAALIAFFATAALTESAGGLLGNWLYPFVAGALVTLGVTAPRTQSGAA